VIETITHPYGKGLCVVPLASVVISNHNYEHFLPEAVDSVLNQTYPSVEVIVVDDGSTDNSREVIESYGDRIVPVLKDNGGQSSACNAGFLVSNGDIVIFFDADDVLLPDTIGSVVTVFQAGSNVAKVQYRLQEVDVHGTPTGTVQPPSNAPIQSGDLRQQILQGYRYFWPSTSGNAFASSVLHQILPIPEDLYRGTPDIYLCNLSPVFGTIVSLGEIGALYRVHGSNNFYSRAIDIDQSRRVIAAVADSYERQRRLLSTLYSADAQKVGSRDLYFLMRRVVLLKLAPQDYPLEDSLLALCTRGCLLSITMPDPVLRKHTRLYRVLWFMIMLFVPKPLAKLVAERFFFFEKRGRLFHSLDSILRRFA
jgi:glycosyltransferase involved in cell wall biosynthesis